MHPDHVTTVFLELVLLIGLGLFGRVAARGLNQPAVLGELLVGVICATIVRLAGGSFEAIVRDLHIFGELGVILLMFFVGLETDLTELLKVGPQALKVAGVGVGAPLILGALTGWVLLPVSSLITSLFIGATLCATSVGITARVFKDLKRLGSSEAKLVLGAAVADDVLGLLILTVVSGIAAQGEFQVQPLIKTVLVAALFLGVIIWFGEQITALAIENLKFLEPGGKRFLIPLSFCLLLSWIAGEIGLAAIIGAFAAGVVVRDSHYGADEGPRIQEQIAPLEELFAPMFFVLMGLQVDLGLLQRGNILLLTLSLCVAAVLGKLACALVVDKKLDRMMVGLGMIPRGEVGLIFAGVGRSLEVFDDEIFAAIILMIVFTTLITPPALRWAVAKQEEFDLPPPPKARG